LVLIALLIDAGDYCADMNLDSYLSQIPRSALAKSLRKCRQDGRRGAEQHHARLGGIDATEVAAHRSV
jgi:hypothetical protein